MTTIKQKPQAVAVDEITDTTITLEDGRQVTRSRFENWADRKGKREFCSDSSNYAGEHEQHTGTHTWDEYYSGPYIAGDLAEYLQEEAQRAAAFNRLGDKGGALRKLKSELL